MSWFSNLFASSNSPSFIKKEQLQNGNTYEVYSAKTAEVAKTFLATKKVTQKLYYIIVETPEGNWGMDIQGLFLENLLPWQKNSSLGTVEGSLKMMSWDQFGLNMAARGMNDNFIAMVECGSCNHEWQDALQYKSLTIVKCPKCHQYNKVSTENINVLYA